MLRIFPLVILLLMQVFNAQAARNLAVVEDASDKRVALVIGNNAYKQVSKLEKAVNDAKAVGAALERVGYDTTVLADASQREMNRAINTFVDNVAGGGEGVLFFAGHGVQIANQNFLLPIDFEKPRNEADVADMAVSLQGVQEKLADARAKYALLVIDACRDNPLPKKAGRSLGGTRGLAQASSASGQMVVFSAGANQQALDKLNDRDRNPNGVFTREFLPWIEKPGIRIRDAILEVRRSVHSRAQSVQHEQLPAVYDQVLGDFYFKPGTPVASLAPSQPVGPAAPQTGGLDLADLQKEEKVRSDWATWQLKMQADHDKVNTLKGSADLKAKAWGRFLAAYPQDNPYSDDDERLREAATQAKTEAEKQPIQLALATPPQSLGTARPGQTFKDCADCPEMVVIPAGSFDMGSHDGDSDEKPVHRVSVSKFALAKTEVTQGQWRAIMGNNPSHFSSCGDDCPVEQVSWDDAQEYIQKLNAKTGLRYRLPSEAEWEYACRAGGNHTYCGSNNLDSVAWYGGNSGRQTHGVAQKQANAFGLYDMSGNVWEWTEDCYHDNYSGAPTDGEAWTSGRCETRVLRGASWDYIPQDARTASRFGSAPDNRDNGGGFRLARTY